MRRIFPAIITNHPSVMAYITITRAQYSEARAKLPDPETYPHPCIDVGVEAPPPDPHLHPGGQYDYIVMFDRLTLDGSPAVLGLSQAYWKLASYYRVVE